MKYFAQRPYLRTKRVFIRITKTSVGHANIGHVNVVGMYRIKFQSNSNEKKKISGRKYERKVTTLYENNLTLKGITLIQEKESQ